MGMHHTTSRLRIRVLVATGLVALGALVAVGTAQAAAPAKVKGTPCTVGVRACVDVDEKQAWLISPEGRIDRGPVDISPGADDTKTPRGDFKVIWKNKDHVSKEYEGSKMPYSVFFTNGGVAFHQGELENPSGGCVRLSMKDAKAFFEYLKVGDRVQVN